MPSLMGLASESYGNKWVKGILISAVLGIKMHYSEDAASRFRVCSDSRRYGKFATLCVLSKTNQEEVKATQVQWTFSLQGIEVVSPVKDSWQVEAGITTYDGDDTTVLIYARLMLAGNPILLTSHMSVIGMPCWYSRTYCGEQLSLVSAFSMVEIPLGLVRFSPTQIYLRLYETGFEVYGVVARLYLESSNCFGGEGKMSVIAMDVTAPPGSVEVPETGSLVDVTFVRDHGQLNFTFNGQSATLVEMRGGAWFPDLDQIATTTVNHKTPQPCSHIAQIDTAV